MAFPRLCKHLPLAAPDTAAADSHSHLALNRANYDFGFISINQSSGGRSRWTKNHRTKSGWRGRGSTHYYCAGRRRCHQTRWETMTAAIFRFGRNDRRTGGARAAGQPADPEGSWNARDRPESSREIAEGGNTKSSDSLSNSSSEGGV